MKYHEYPKADTYYYANGALSVCLLKSMVRNLYSNTANRSWFYKNPDDTKFYHNGGDTCRIEVPSGPRHAFIYATFKRLERKGVPDQECHGVADILECDRKGKVKL